MKNEQLKKAYEDLVSLYNEDISLGARHKIDKIIKAVVLEYESVQEKIKEKVMSFDPKLLEDGGEELEKTYIESNDENYIKTMNDCNEFRTEKSSICFDKIDSVLIDPVVSKKDYLWIRNEIVN